MKAGSQAWQAGASPKKLVAALCLVLVGTQAMPRPARESSSTLAVAGKVTDASKTRGIGAIARLSTSGAVAGCTGTLVAPRVVVTAKHCLSNLPASGGPVALPASSFQFWTGSLGGVFPERTLAVSAVAIDGTNAGGFIGYGADVAMMHLATEVTGVPYAEPRQLKNSPYKFASKAQPRWIEKNHAAQPFLAALGTQTFAVIGFGQTSRLNGLQYAGSGGRTAALMHTKELGFLRSQSSDRDVNAYQEIWLTYATGAACHGDSGGPLFTAEYDPSTKKMIPVLYGVLSGGDTNGVMTPWSPAPEDGSGKECGDTTMPVVYSLFSDASRKFIDDTMRGWNERSLRWSL